MAYTSKYKQAEIEAILDAKNNTGAGVDATLDGLFVDSLQTKDVELSESAEITPDEGFLGLKKVNVSVKGGCSEGGDEYVYLDVRSLSLKDRSNFIYSSVEVRSETDSVGFIPTGLFFNVLKGAVEESMVAVKINPSARLVVPAAQVNTNLKDFLKSQGWDIDSLPRITEEEFYALGGGWQRNP